MESPNTCNHCSLYRGSRRPVPSSQMSTPANSSKKPPPPPAGGGQGAKGDTDYFEAGSKLRDRWLLEKRIGDGAFGQVFLAKDCRENINVAIKTEKIEVKRRCLCMEVGVMRELGKSQNVPYIVACGRTPVVRYIVMELLGGSLFDLTKTFPNRLVPIETTCRIGLQSMRALQDVHQAGFVHRDVKPANFALGKHPKVAGNVFIYDFGLSRPHLIKGKPRGRRKWNPGFRGTVRYASIASHIGVDLGRVDDLIPIWYMLIEFYKGKLPWHGMGDRHEVKIRKEAVTPEQVCEGMPKEMSRMGRALEIAHYRSEPRYEKIMGLMEAVLIKMKQNPKKPITPGPL